MALRRNPAQGYTLVVTKSDGCHTCNILQAQGLFDQLEMLKPTEVSEVFTYSFSTLSQSADVSELFNKNMWFPNLKLMPNEVYQAAANGASFRSIASRVRFYNAEYDPLVPLMKLRETHHYPEIMTLDSTRTFCRDAIASLKADVSLTEYFEGPPIASSGRTSAADRSSSSTRLVSRGDNEYWHYTNRR